MSLLANSVFSDTLLALRDRHPAGTIWGGDDVDASVFPAQVFLTKWTCDAVWSDEAIICVRLRLYVSTHRPMYVQVAAARKLDDPWRLKGRPSQLVSLSGRAHGTRHHALEDRSRSVGISSKENMPD
ncbi:hypothetical protein M409DRAFT_49771 [Zasmidium cellare ATCC 36951]|uniref:Uncharacterized protein n=1 Tax=Zasmidium cellare ATCC 36951 TaxID=1080233 RepID=A0A6A6D4L0_ZASCE|nr:uncharacterized protein M409DRAFT_49771 [Zasmidium cellare ATCC 36951]KAF2173310.1 hypothetical protein M409DRAFT_49771 [Zasmidium cellare ATCC 36951]